MKFYVLCLRFRVSASVSVTDGITSDNILGPPPSSPDLTYKFRFFHVRIVLISIVMIEHCKNQTKPFNSPRLQLAGTNE